MHCCKDQRCVIATFMIRYVNTRVEAQAERTSGIFGLRKTFYRCPGRAISHVSYVISVLHISREQEMTYSAARRWVGTGAKC
jgi:hypothetical protein